MAYILFNLKSGTADGKNHFLLQLLLFFFIIAGVVMLGKATLDTSQNNCEWLVANSTVSGNVTTNVHSYQCSANADNTGFIFYKGTLWFARLAALYIFVHFMWYMLQYIGWVVPK